MKRFVWLLCCVALFAAGPRSELTDREKLDFLPLVSDYLETQSKFKAATDRMEARIVELREKHNAPGCVISQALKWACSAANTPNGGTLPPVVAK